MSETALVKSSNAVERVEPTAMEMIAAVLERPDLDVQKLEKMIELKERLDAKAAEREFNIAMAELQNDLPQIDKLARGQNSKYARLEDIDAVIRPMMASRGFSRSLTEEARNGQQVTFALKIRHRSGHVEVTRGTFTIDEAGKNSSGKPIRPPTQDDGSTRSYAERYLLCDALGIVTRGVDNDGAPTQRISQDQARDIEIALKDTKSDVAGFLKYMGVASIADIRVVDLKKATNALDQKRRESSK